MKSNGSCSTLVQMLRQRAATDPDKTFTFLRDGHSQKGVISFKKLDQQAKTIANILKEHVSPGDRVLINHLPGLDYISSFFGCLYAGVIAVPVYPPRFNQKMDRLNAILNDVTPKVSLTSSSVLETLSPFFNSHSILKNMPWVETDRLSLEDGADWSAPDIDADSIAFIQYTSGSTSLPKGVILSHGNLLNNLKGIEHSFMATDKCVTVSWLPPYHDMGLIGEILAPIYCRIPAILMSPFTFLLRPFRWLQAINNYKANISGGPNFAYALCTKRITEKQLAQLDLSSWDIAFCGAEPIRVEVLREFTQKFSRCGFRAKAFYPCYGLAEASLMVTGVDKKETIVTCHLDGKALENEGRVEIVEPDAKDARSLVSCGKAIQNHSLRIIDPQDFDPCADGKVGEIWFSGPSVAQGYWKRPEETQKTFKAQNGDFDDENTYFRTGDLGFIHEGHVYITGRIKDLVIIRGRNYYPQDIEFTSGNAHSLLGSGSCAAFSIEGLDEEKLVIIQEVNRKTKEEDYDEIIHAIHHQVFENHGINPFAISLIKSNSIPVTSSGKIQRYASRHQFIEGQLEELKRYTSIEPETRL